MVSTDTPALPSGFVFPDPPPNPWQTLTQREVYRNNWIAVEDHTVRDAAGRDGVYGVVRFHNRALGIVAVDSNEVIMVGQWRYPFAAYSWEIPAGGGEPGQSSLAAAQRELQEETGYTAEQWTQLQTLQLSNSATDEIGHVYLAQDLSAGPANPTPDEQLHIVRVPLDDAFALLHRGDLIDSLTVVGLLALENGLLRGTISR